MTMAFITIDKNSGPNFVMEDNIIKGFETIFHLKTTNIGQAILNIFNDEPDHIAQIEAETGKQTTFNEMKEDSIRCAFWMQKQGVGVGDVVAICTHNHLNAYIPVIGALLNGAIYNPWHHEVTLKSAQHLMNLTKPKVIFTCELAVDVLQEAARLENIAPKIIVFGNHPSLQSLKEVMDMQMNENVETFEVPIIKDEEAIAIILFSSGTSGMPKGVVHSYKWVLKNIMNFPFPPSHKSVCLWYSLLYWVTGTWSMLISILAGATVLVHENFDPIETCKVIERYKVNWFFISPTMITRWVKSGVLKDFELKSLNTIFTGGSKSNQEFLDELKRSIPNAPIFQVYGMTELGIPALIQTNDCQMLDSVGFVSPNIQLKVIDIKTGKPLGPNEPGELCVKLASMAVGYYKDPAATKSAIDEDGWIHTGDKVFYNKEGEFRIIDRIKNVLKFRGHQISPYEIEEILIRHPDVMEAAVVSVPHKIDIEQPMAFIQKIPGSKVTEDELIELSATLGKYKKLWGGVKFLEEIPLTASGKINRNQLREMALMYSR